MSCPHHVHDKSMMRAWSPPVEPEEALPAPTVIVSVGEGLGDPVVPTAYLPLEKYSRKPKSIKFRALTQGNALLQIYATYEQKIKVCVRDMCLCLHPAATPHSPCRLCRRTLRTLTWGRLWRSSPHSLSSSIPTSCKNLACPRCVKPAFTVSSRPQRYGCVSSPRRPQVSSRWIFTCSCQRLHKDSYRLRMFGIMAGLIDTETYTPRIGAVVLRLIHLTFPRFTARTFANNEYAPLCGEGISCCATVSAWVCVLLRVLCIREGQLPVLLSHALSVAGKVFTDKPVPLSYDQLMLTEGASSSLLVCACA